MDSYTLNTVNYNYKTLSHEGFGGVCKYIATPKRVGYSRLLVKHENIQSACNTFMCSRLAELCDVYTPKAYLMSTSNETRRLFPMHPFIVGAEWVEDFSAVDYGSIKESPALRQQYLDSMALYAMFCRIADTPQFAYSPAKGVFAYDWDEAFDVTDFVIKLCLYNTDAGTEQLRRMLRHFSQHPFESDAELCLRSAAEHMTADANNLRPSYKEMSFLQAAFRRRARCGGRRLPHLDGGHGTGIRRLLHGQLLVVRHRAGDGLGRLAGGQGKHLRADGGAQAALNAGLLQNNGFHKASSTCKNSGYGQFAPCRKKYAGSAALAGRASIFPKYA